MEFMEVKRICDCPAKGQCSCNEMKPDDVNCFGGFKRYSIIKASAGTGKTYRLAMRYVQLLMLGVRPEKILALTFTRKAAGEIHRRIITRLFEMIGNGVDCCAVRRERMIGILRSILNCPKSLQIGTIDSFFAKMLVSFAPELGIWGQGSIIDYDDNRYRRDVVHRWILAIADKKDEIGELRELLKNANNNTDEVMIEAKLLALVDSIYSFYLQHEDSFGNALDWGCRMSIPPDPYRDDLDSYMTDVSILAGFAQLQEKSCKAKLGAFAEFASKIVHEYSGVVPELVKKLFNDNFIKHNGEDWCLQNGSVLVFGKRPACEIYEDMADIIRRIFLHIAHLAFVQSQKRTDSIHKLAQAFDREYSAQVRNFGLLTFQDLPFLLAGAGGGEGGILAEEAMEALEYRLDSQIRHYLFDEFQDTADSQWAIFDRITSNQLLSTIPDDFRSFFCVGDIKQSIYGWRGGNPKLFGYLEHRLDAFREELGYTPSGSLTKSYRSSRSVLELVNNVFESGQDGAPDALKRIEFMEHSAGKGLEGFSALLNMRKKNDTRSQLSINAETIFQILQKIQPQKRGLSVGILVQSNKSAAEYLDELKALARIWQSDLKFSAHGRVALTDTAAFTVLKELLVLSAHPGDTMASEYLKMLVFSDAQQNGEVSPMTSSELLGKLGFGENAGNDLSGTVRHDIATNGLHGFIDRFIRAFAGQLPQSDRNKLVAVLHLSEAFDGTTDEFLKSLENAGGDEKSLENTVQIMTIHQSKGLEFDILFTPDLGNTRGYHGNSWEPAVDIPSSQGTSDGGFARPEWITYFPDVYFVSHVRAYAEYARKKEDEENFAKLCKTYVALTRAKRALFVMVSPPEKPTVFAPDKWIYGRLEDAASKNLPGQSQTDFFNEIENADELISNVVYACGNSNWYENVSKCSMPDGMSDRMSDGPIRMGVSKKHERLASKEHQLQLNISPDKRFTIKSTTETGTIVHELFEQIGFIGNDWNVEAFLAEHAGNTKDPFASLAVEIVRRAMQDDSPVRQALRKPADNVELWLERRFLLQNGANEVIPGAFDRVVISRDGRGRATDAVIYDYKSDALNLPEEFLERHAAQLNLYRKALAKLLNLDELHISCRILALRPVLVIDVPREE